MSWRDRAIKVDNNQQQIDNKPIKHSSWKDRAIPVDNKETSQENSFIDKYGEEYIRPALQAIGMGGGAIGGGALGALAGGIGAVPGGVAGAGLGYAGAEQVYDVIKQLLGSGKAKTLPEELQETITDIGTGGLAEVSGQAGGKIVEKGAGLVKPYIKKGIERVGKSIYGVPEKATKTILERPKEVIAAADKDLLTSGRELINKVNKAKEKIITPASEGLNRELELATSKGSKVDLDTIITNLEKRKNALGTPKTTIEVSENSQIQNQIKILKKYRETVGSKISPKEANKLKRSLQKSATYNTDSGMTIRRGANDPVGNVIKDTARDVRLAVEDVAPGVKKYNKAIERVAKATESKKTGNMLKEENIEGTLRNLQNETGNKSIAREQMGRIDKVLGTDILPTAENIYASKYMKKPDLLSAMPTGRSILPIILGGAGGYASGGGGSGIAEGALLAAALASPTTYRYAMPQVAKMLNLPASQLASYGLRSALINKGE